MHFAALATVVVAAAALRLFRFDGYIGLDVAEHARIAHQIANGTFSLEYGGPPVFPLWVGLILPTDLIFRMFGLSVTFPLCLAHLNGGRVSKYVREEAPCRKAGTAGGGKRPGRFEAIGYGRTDNVPA